MHVCGRIPNRVSHLAQKSRFRHHPNIILCSVTLASFMVFPETNFIFVWQKWGSFWMKTPHLQILVQKLLSCVFLSNMFLSISLPLFDGSPPLLTHHPRFRKMYWNIMDSLLGSSLGTKSGFKGLLCWRIYRKTTNSVGKFKTP